MSNISLYQYHEQIEELIEESRLTEAVAHCRHILEEKPRHIASYRLLGKALLEQQKYAGAIDIFQRVLSAEPEDFISHVGLAIAYKSDQLIPLATWHMERAFEIDSYNVVVQDELKMLYAERDGSVPERLVLTQGALVRLQYRSKMYNMANAGIRQILADDEARIDMKTLLAESLWRDDQRVDAVAVCLDILEELPNCINANAILAEVWLLTGRKNEAVPYLELLQQLTLLDSEMFDLESPTGRAFSSSNDMIIPDQIWVTELDEVPFAYDSTGADSGADWVVELDDADDSDVGMAWFDMDGADDLGAEMPAENDMIEDVPQWLKELGGDMPTPVVEPKEALVESEVIATLVEAEDEPVDFSDNVPDWLDGIEEMPELPESDALDWFSDVEAPEPTGRKAEKSGFTDWLNRQESKGKIDMTPPDEADLALDQILQTGEISQEDDVPDWLQEALDVEVTVLPDQVLEKPAVLASKDVETTDVPDWLDELRDDTQPEMETEPELESLSDQVPDWLADLEEGMSSSPQSAEGSIDDLDDFFDDVLVQTGDISGLLQDAVNTAPPSVTEDSLLGADPLIAKEKLLASEVSGAKLKDGELASWLDEVGDRLTTNDSGEESKQ